MRKAAIVALILTMGLVFSAATGALAADESLYSGMIDQKIARCQLKGKLINSSGENLRNHARMAADQAVFYQEKKAELVDMLMRENAGASPYKVSYCLIKAYKANGAERQLATR